MADIEKVIKAIECRANGNGQQGCVGCDVDCPYSFSHVFCDQNQLYLDALALLKEQEAVEPQIAPFPDASRSDGSWYYICGACSKPIDQNDKYCRECGKPILWEDR